MLAGPSWSSGFVCQVFANWKSCLMLLPVYMVAHGYITKSIDQKRKTIVFRWVSTFKFQNGQPSLPHLCTSINLSIYLCKYILSIPSTNLGAWQPIIDAEGTQPLVPPRCPFATISVTSCHATALAAVGWSLRGTAWPAVAPTQADRAAHLWMCSMDVKIYICLHIYIYICLFSCLCIIYNCLFVYLFFIIYLYVYICMRSLFLYMPGVYVFIHSMFRMSLDQTENLQNDGAVRQPEKFTTTA